MKRNVVSFRSNARLARQLWGEPSSMALRSLRELTTRHSLSVAAGDLQFLEGRWYVTHSGLLQLASRRGCHGIKTIAQDQFSDATAGRWVFKAVVYKSGLSRGFVGYGDADPSNTSPLVRGAEMRVAETRAVNRALRKAYGIGLCSVEELGSFSAPQMSLVATPHSNGQSEIKWLKQRPASITRPTVPADSPARSRSHSRESLCRGFLRHRDPEGCQPRLGRIVHHSACGRREERIETPSCAN